MNESVRCLHFGALKTLLSLLRRMLLDGQAKGPMATDAQLAALTLEYGGVLHTTDRGFARFPGLRWVNPLLGS
jgi:hypothetical protein